MHCPYCNHTETQVKDSRPCEDGASIRRRRMCPECQGRFTTFERVQLREFNVVKNDGSVEPFDRDKLFRSMHLPLRKRPVEREQLEKVVSSIVRQLETSGESEISTREVGAMVMQALGDLDKIAYIRYASVYKDFREVDDFNQFIDEVTQLKEVK
ncbi:MAG: transcriptional regulator NrdR [Rickettsiales bacterium]|nr:transcriptional regulator NrdR [Rickettsiales bacterium]|tara:strand:+ start:950 stop:1414 length:465 start_codon:yes stop_codon:yes gene_type:complete